MNRYLRFALVTIILVGLLAPFASPASANSKVTSYWEFAATSPEVTCQNGQILIEEFAVYADQTDFYTESGELFMEEVQITQTGKEYLKAEPDKVIYYENEHWKNMLKPGGQVQSSGIIMKVTIPGYGMVFQDIGHIVFEYDPVAGHLVPTFLAGQHHFFDPAAYPDGWNYAPACKYLTSLP